MGIQGSFAFGDDPFIVCRPIDMGHKHRFVISKKLTQALVGPVVHEFLPCDLVKELFRIVHNERQLHMVSEVAAVLDLRVSILHDPCLRSNPQRVDEMRCITFCVQVVVFPQILEAGQRFDVHRLTQFDGRLYSFLKCAPWLHVELGQVGTHPTEGSPGGVGIASVASMIMVKLCSMRSVVDAYS